MFLLRLSFPPSSLLFSPLLSAGHYTMTLLSLVLALSLLLSTSNAKMQKCNKRANNALHREMTKSNSTTSSTSTTASATYESGTKASAWFPVDKIRGVNLGSWFLIEPVSFPFGEVASQRPLSNRTSLYSGWCRTPGTRWDAMGTPRNGVVTKFSESKTFNRSTNTTGILFTRKTTSTR